MSRDDLEYQINKSFEEEAIAYMKYVLFADLAKKKGNKVLSDLFLKLAGNEKEHAEVYFDHMFEDMCIKDILNHVIEYEKNEADYYYMRSDKDIPSEFQKKFLLNSIIEKTHMNQLEDIKEEILTNTLFYSEDEIIWECSECGSIHKGTEPPSECPFCSHPSDYFIKK